MQPLRNSALATISDANVFMTGSGVGGGYSVPRRFSGLSGHSPERL